MNQSTVKHTEVGLRLTICSEFLLNEQKPIEVLYARWMRRVRGPIIEFAEFEYWCRRFKNNQFDLGYDTSLDSKETSVVPNTMNSETSGVRDDSAVIIKKEVPFNIVNNHQFNEKDVPEVFRDFMKDNMNSLKTIELTVFDQYCTLILDKIELHLEKKGNNWLITYKNIERTFKTDNPEQSIIDHLWFVLKNPDIKLKEFGIQALKKKQFGIQAPKNPQSLVICQNQPVPKIDFEKVNTLLQSMIDSIDHQFHTNGFFCDAFDTSVFLSMLKHLKPGTLESFSLDNSRENKRNDQKMKEIIETDQWKRAKGIFFSKAIPPVEIDDLLHCERFMLSCDTITPEYVLRAKELFANSTNTQSWFLFFGNKILDINAFRKVLLPNSLSEKKVRIVLFDCIVFTYKLPNSPNYLEVSLNEYDISFEKKPN